MMCTLESLTEDQKRLLSEFNELSGSATTHEEDVLYLTLCAWDLNKAVGIWWDSDCVMEKVSTYVWPLVFSKKDNDFLKGVFPIDRLC